MKCKIMGILNVTPDSFSDGGVHVDCDSAVRFALQMEKDGADIIDIGGESSRPGAGAVSVEEELKRVLPVIAAIRRQSNIPISIDTTKSRVAREAVQCGATMINDISAGLNDPEMFLTAAKLGVDICLMHMQGEPQSMQKNPHYENVVEEVKDFLRERIEAAEKSGIAKDKIIIDPGIGFGKTVEHNIDLLKNLDALLELGCPILVGTSRKSFIGKITGASVENRLPGSLASIGIAIQNGATLVRVHDVPQTHQFLSILKLLI